MPPYGVRFEERPLHGEARTGFALVQRLGLQHRDGDPEHGALLYARHVVRVDTADTEYLHDNNTQVKTFSSIV